MKAFGIELRKADSHNIYKDVDLVLAKHNIGTGVSAEVQRQALGHSLHKMMRAGNYFSICTINDCAKMCQVHIPEERMAVYSSIHCVGWNEMEPEFRELV